MQRPTTIRALAAMAGVLAAAGTMAVAPASLASPLQLVAPATGSFDIEANLARTADGKLHVVYELPAPTRGFASRTISPGGKLGRAVQGLAGWSIGYPAITPLPGGKLETVFSAQPPSPLAPGVYGVESSDGGASWGAPANVGTGTATEAADSSATLTAHLLGATPTLTLNAAGAIDVQSGFGPSATVTPVAATPADSGAANLNTQVDAAAGELVGAWQSSGRPGGDIVQGIAPAVQPAQVWPGKRRSFLQLSARDKGPGVFGAYTLDGRAVRLARYRSGTVAVGKVKGLTAQVLGTATGSGGRIWVMWGDSTKRLVAITRSNRAVTRFEPIQMITSNALSLTRLYGDGRLGPLDLLIDEAQYIPNAVVTPATYYTRVLAILAAAVKVTPVVRKGKFVAHELTVKVSDAGDPVAGATVKARGVKGKTSAHGVAKLTLPGTAPLLIAVTVTAPSYHAVHLKVQL